MTMAVLLTVLLTAFIPSSALAQVRSQDAGAEKTGTIRGRITAADTGKPLRRARVRVLPEKRDGFTRPAEAHTNSRGEFEVGELPEGSYYVSATRAGFVDVEYGRRRPFEQGLAITVQAGQVRERIDLAMPRAGVLAGQITDELSEPYPGVRVDALMLHYRNGRKEPQIVSGATTDDRGHYRISGLQPGSYFVVATSSETWRNEKRETIGFPSTYYPGGTFDQARPVTLGPSEQRTDLHINLQSARTARLSGVVVRERGEPVPGTTVTAAYSYPGVFATSGMRSIRTGPDGSFTIKDVPGGTYRVMSGGDDAVLTVTGVDIDGIVLTHRTGSTVSGTIVTDEGTPPPFPVSGVRVMLETSSDKVLPTVRVVQAADDWSFKMQGLGGPFVFRLTGLPDDWMLASGTLNGRDITDEHFDVPTGGKEITGATLVVTRKVTRVAGTVLDDRGNPTSAATVLVFADDSTEWFPYSRAVRVTRPDTDGRFTITHLPPGTYRAVALEFIERGQEEDVAFLTELRDAATLFNLMDGGTQTLRLERR
ncbi:MAG TPA: carboxypeptidase-like regulatory domain-containing protein [Vicinamibacterales bacterium]